MKTLLLLSVLSIHLIAYSSVCEVDTFIKNNCYNTALKLSMFDMRNDLQLKDSINIPDYVSNKYLSILSSIYELHTPTTDSIFYEYKILNAEVDCVNGYCYSEASIYFKADTNMVWVNKLIKERTFAYNPILESIFTKYNYTIQRIEVSSKAYDPTATIYMSTPNYLNIYPILEILENTAGVYYAEPETQLIGDSPGIKVLETGYSHIVTFRRGWMDCSAGCINNTYWHYEVTGCTAQVFIDIPVSTTKKQVSTVTIYPNPVENIVTFKNLHKDILVNVLSVQGQTIISLYTSNQRLDLSELSSGMYMLSYKLNGKKEIKKIIKR